MCTNDELNFYMNIDRKISHEQWIIESKEEHLRNKNSYTYNKKGIMKIMVFDQKL